WLTVRTQITRGYASRWRRSLRFFSLFGKAKPLRSSGGKAALQKPETRVQCSLPKNHHRRLALHKHVAVLIRADRLERDDRFVFADVRNGRRCRDSVADENGCGEFQGL